jgi:hypothetical protein
MSWVLSKIFSPVDHVSFTAEVVNPVGYAFRVDVFLSTRSKVLTALEAL